jgi:hypothetical protein
VVFGTARDRKLKINFISFCFCFPRMIVMSLSIVFLTQRILSAFFGEYIDNDDYLLYIGG